LQNAITNLNWNVWRWSFFEHFLVTALQRAVAITKVNRVAFAITNDLNLDVSWVL
jgi:hypothetical protein